MTVTYRHWLEHRGSAGLVAELLRPAEAPALDTPPATAAEAHGPSTQGPAAAPQTAATAPPEPSAG
jgi:hypothetical protein